MPLVNVEVVEQFTQQGDEALLVGDFFLVGKRLGW